MSQLPLHCPQVQPTGPQVTLKYKRNISAHLISKKVLLVMMHSIQFLRFVKNVQFLSVFRYTYIYLNMYVLPKGQTHVQHVFVNVFLSITIHVYRFFLVSFGHECSRVLDLVNQVVFHPTLHQKCSIFKCFQIHIHLFEHVCAS